MSKYDMFSPDLRAARKVLALYAMGLPVETASVYEVLFALTPEQRWMLVLSLTPHRRKCLMQFPEFIQPLLN